MTKHEVSAAAVKLSVDENSLLCQMYLRRVLILCDAVGVFLNCSSFIYAPSLLSYITAVLFCDGTSWYGVPENLTTG